MCVVWLWNNLIDFLVWPMKIRLIKKQSHLVFLIETFATSVHHILNKASDWSRKPLKKYLIGVDAVG